MIAAFRSSHNSVGCREAPTSHSASWLARRQLLFPPTARLFCLARNERSRWVSKRMWYS